MSMVTLVDRVAGRLQGTVSALKPKRLHRLNGAAFEAFAIVPPDLRTTDVGFLDEIKSGLFGVAGHVMVMSAKHPFAMLDAPRHWLLGVHGFAWLRHLDAVGTRDAEVLARDLVDHWLATQRQHRVISSGPDVVARRVLSWLAHAGLILDGDDRAHYDRIAEALVNDMRLLDRIWRKAAPGVPRLIAALARVQVHLSLASKDRVRQRAERDLLRELSIQVLADGSHVSRNPSTPVHLMLDLLPLRQCYQAREIPVPGPIFAAMRRIVPYVRFMRHGDGALANFHGAIFNGSSRVSPDELAAVVGFDAAHAPMPVEAPQSGYVRLAAAGTVLIADVAAPPKPTFASDATAGCLAFELSSAHARIISNPVFGARDGARGGVHSAHADGVTWCHSTLCLDQESSALRVGPLKGVSVFQMPGAVAREPQVADGLSFAAVHAGYADRYGVDHTRRVTLATDGRSLTGVDILVRIAQSPKSVTSAAARHLFAIHFHVDPTAHVRRGDQSGEIVLELRDGQRWQFSADAALMAIEETPGYKMRGGHKLQIVLRAAIEASTSKAAVTWSFKRLDGPPAFVSPAAC
jgi:uncharacterized heparinase superfamily protein